MLSSSVYAYPATLSVRLLRWKEIFINDLVEMTMESCGCDARKAASVHAKGRSF